MGIYFTESEESRYARHELITWWDQAKLAQTHVIVAGAGALGNEVLKLLALIGIGQITVIDFDVISRSNLARMVLFREADIGRPKVEVAVERLHEINPEVQVRGVQGDLRFDLGLGDYRAADLVFGCLDSVNARWALNRKCLQAGVDWIDGGISDHHGLVAHYGATGACYECNFTPATHERFNRRYSCPFGLASSQAEDKVPTTAITTSVIAGIQVQQALLMLHGNRDESLPRGERLMVYLKPFQMLRDKLPENPSCLAHDPLPAEIPALDVDPETTIRAALAAAARQNPYVEMLSLPYDLVIDFHCPHCGAVQSVYRPKEKVFQTEMTCPECGHAREPRMTSEIRYDDPVSQLSLREIWIPPREILAFRTGHDRVYFQIGEQP